MLRSTKKLSLRGATTKYTALAAILLAYFNLGCSGKPGPLIGVKGIVLYGPWFSPDGQFLILPIAHIDGPSESPYGVSDTVAVYKTGTWKKVFEYTAQSNANGTVDETIDDVYMCGDPDVLIHASSNKAFLIFRSMTTGQIINSVNNIEWPPPDPNAGRHWCDLDNNYLFFPNREKVTVLDGSTGKLVKEYDATGAGTSEFIIQKEKDRLLVVGDPAFVFRLSTTEFLGQVKVWPQAASPLPNGFSTGLVDEDHLLYSMYGTKDGIEGTYLFLVDLNGMKVESESCLSGIDSFFLSVMEPGSDNVLIDIYPNQSNESIATVNYRTGDVQHSLDVDTTGIKLDNTSVSPIPEIKRVYLSEVSDVKYPLKAWVLDYPELSVLHESPSVVNCGYTTWVSTGKFLVNSCNSGFGVYDPVNFKVMDSFHFLCKNPVGYQVDPLERWAAVQCDGEWPKWDEIPPYWTPGAYPDGAGVAIVELDRYRRSQ